MARERQIPLRGRRGLVTPRVRYLELMAKGTAGRKAGRAQHPASVTPCAAPTDWSPQR